MGKNKIGIWFDEETDVLYVSLRKGACVDSEEIEEGVRIEYDAQGQIVVLEISEMTRRLAKPLAKRLAKIVK